jgi:aldehyde:ferredoxin oxidoreductase
MYLRNGLVSVVDLGTGESVTQEATESLISGETTFGAYETLHQEHPDSLVLGTGVLTGSLVPAACAATLSHMQDGRLRTIPVMGLAGAELKLSGFDFVVVKGAAPRPGYLWLRDGIAEFVPDPDMAALDSWSRTDKVRKDQGDRRIQVLSSGPWGDSSLGSSSLVVNHWLGEDEVGLSSVLGSKRLTAIAFRGMGEVDVADSDGHFEESLSLRVGHAERLGMSLGLASYSEAARGEAFTSLTHRVSGCFGCPYPCRSFLKVNESPGEMAIAHKEPGYLHYDIPSYEAMSSAGMSPRDITLALMACAKHGADPLSISRECDADLDELDSILSSKRDVPRVSRASLTGSFTSCASYSKALALGLCPRYWEKVGFDLAAVSRCAEPALGRPIA